VPENAAMDCISRSQRLFIASNSDEKTFITQLLTDFSMQRLGTTGGVVYAINGLEIKSNWGMIDGSENLIPEMIPPLAPSTEHCLAMTEFQGTIVPYRVGCDRPAWYVCQSQA
jgi:hypothetical protein